jgi:VacB/RNase II family 3'-5' exoribonuclease
MLNNETLGALKQLKQEIRTARNVKRGQVIPSRANFGFVKCEDNKQVFLAPDEMAKVLPGDIVDIEINKDKGGRESGTIEVVFKTELTEFYGFVVERGRNLFVEADSEGLSRWVFIPPKERYKAKRGDRVRCKVLRHPFKNEGKTQGKILEVIGNAKDVAIETNYAIRKHGLPTYWPANVADEINTITSRQKTLLKERQDFSKIPFVTIDSANTSDMDDALFAEKTASGWLLKVAIADPSALIEEGSMLDKVAAKRSSAVYFPHKVIPMLPELMASDLCSLMPQQKRLAIVITLAVNSDGSTKDLSIAEATISSHAKLSYSQVSHFLQDNKVADFSGEIVDSLTQLQAISEAMLSYRLENHLVNEDRKDYFFQLGENGKIQSVNQFHKTVAHTLVEQCMLATNSAIAKEFANNGIKSAYSVHQGLRTERLTDALTLLNKHTESKWSTQELDSLAGFIRFTREFSTSETELPLLEILRRMFARGDISPQPQAHKGLGLQQYLTVTSPIRRYQDLLIHRQLKQYIAGDQITPIDNAKIEQIRHSLDTIRTATFETDHWLKAQFATTLIGKKLSGKVIKVTNRQLGIRLDETGVEGQLETKNLAEKYHFNSLELSLTAENSSYVLGKNIEVIISSVDADKQLIRMVLAKSAAVKPVTD